MSEQNRRKRRTRYSFFPAAKKACQGRAPGPLSTFRFLLQVAPSPNTGKAETRHSQSAYGGCRTYQSLPSSSTSALLALSLLTGDKSA